MDTPGATMGEVRAPRLLGAAFLGVVVTSLTSGLLLMSAAGAGSMSDMLESRLNDAVLGRWLGVREEALKVGEGLGKLLRGHGRRVGGLRFGLLAVEALHRRLPCVRIPVLFEASRGLLAFASEAPRQ